jgi:hypothetical protein
VEARLYDALPEARRGVERLIADRSASSSPPWDLRSTDPGDAPATSTLAVADVVRAQGAARRRSSTGVLVMVDDAAIRANRLALLAAVADALSDLGDPSEARRAGASPVPPRSP